MPSPHDSQSSLPRNPPPSQEPIADSSVDEVIGIREASARLHRGLPQMIGLAAIGLVVAAVVYLLVSPLTTATTSMRVAFGFEGYSKGLYPDKSKFDPDDLRAPDLIIEALKRKGLDVTEDFQARIRAAITVEGFVPLNVTKEHDRLRILGQPVPAYIPDEFIVSIALPRRYLFSDRQREQLMSALVGAYQDKFERTYAHVPQAFGNAFTALRNADMYEYEYIFNSEIQNLKDYLGEELSQATNYRSPTTNMTFSDLLLQTKLFQDIRSNEVLGLIRQNGLSRDRNEAMVKMDYLMQVLGDEEAEASDEEKVVQDLLAKSQERTQNYVLGVKSEAVQPRPETPILDQGLIDSLLENDAYNFLVRKALDAGIHTTEIKAERAQLAERRKEMEAFTKDSPPPSPAILDQVRQSLVTMEGAYDELISNIRKTHDDFARQQFADAIRITAPARTLSVYLVFLIVSAVGSFLGFALGAGLSLVGVFIKSSKVVAP